MRDPTRTAIGVIGTAAVLVSLAMGLTGVSGAGEASLLQSSLAPSQTSDPTIHGVVPGGFPWALREGRVELADGRLRLQVQGLVIPVEHTVGGVTFPAGTARPVTSIAASLFCGGDAATTPSLTTKTVPITRRGDAEIDQRVKLPQECLAPVVMVNPNGNTAAYIAITGFRP